MSITCHREDEWIVVTGNTYPHKEAIKSYGATFRRSDKSWVLPYSEKQWRDLNSFCKRMTEGPHNIEHMSHGILDNTLGNGNSNISHDTSTCFSVAHLAKLIASKVAQAFPMRIWVIGEVQNLSLSRGNHYFTLAEPKESVAELTRSSRSQATHTMRAIIWRDTFPKLQNTHTAKLIDDLLSDGMKIKILASIQLYQQKSEISLHVHDVDPQFTQGELGLERQKHIQVLKKEGVFENNKALQLPLFPFRIGLITAGKSRAYSDFLHQLNTESNGITTLFVSATMQGEKTSADIIKALDTLEAATCDIIVITRGGGSSADLRWFNDLTLGRRIAQAQVPVFAAIGHHDDESLVQDVAHQAVKTPTALADLILDLFSDLRRRLDNMKLSMASALESCLLPYVQELNWLQERLGHASSQYLHSSHNQLTNLTHQLERNTTQKIATQETALQQLCNSFLSTVKESLMVRDHQLSLLQKTLESHSPLVWIDAGWSPIMKDKKRIHSIKEISHNDHIQLALKDGSFTAQVTTITPLKQTT
ncbi:MAG: exodeoxyribonuclease VII large subunit [Proteobacteria bacterium]|nr:exodeoxyribonuclease VII large subunit [Pseudomonadota bacterium]